MGVSHLKPEFPALLGAGFHIRTLGEVRELCVRAFATSLSRRAIMDGIEQIIRKLNEFEVAGEMWLDGSFVTSKIDPDDVDSLLRVSSDIYEGDATKRTIIDWATEPDRWNTHSCDSYCTF